MSSRRRRSIDIFNLSFLDVVSCGFGAIILLLVLLKIAEPVVLEAVRADLSGVVADLDRRIHEIRGDTTRVRRDLELGRARLADLEGELAALEAELAAVRGRQAEANRSLETQEVIEGQLAAALLRAFAQAHPARCERANRVGQSSEPFGLPYIGRRQ